MGAKFPWKRYLLRCLYIICSVVALIFAFLYYTGMFNGNVRTVQPGELYRSGQLRRLQLKNVLEANYIKSVINLRGYSTTNADLNDERSFCKVMGIKHVDINMSACRLPEPNELQKLIKAFDTLPRPILVHCRAGSDRAGLASTLYMHIYENMPLDKAQSSQLTWRYGHISFGQAHAIDDFFSLYRKNSEGLSIRKWISQKYPSVYLEQKGYEASPSYQKEPDTNIRK